MRPSFESNIEGYRSVARKAVEIEAKDQEEGRNKTEPSQEAKDLRPVKDFFAREGAQKSNTDLKTQQEIYLIQEDKQRVMRQLKADLQSLDNKEHVWHTTFGERLVKQEGDRFFVRGRNGNPDMPITKGELLTDLAWNKRYSLDKGVDPHVRKQYLVAKATQQLQRLYDKQITADRSSSRQVHYWKQDAYLHREASTGFEKGFLAEKMVKGFLEKLSIDHGLDFEVIESNAYLDVEQKMDFIIRRKGYLRGVDVEEDESAKSVGVQFTSSQEKDIHDHKRVQIARVKEEGMEDKIDDLVLVTLPATEVREIFYAWNKDQDPGGPDKLWSEETKRDVFFKVMQDIMKPDEIAAQWKKATGEPDARSEETAQASEAETPSEESADE